MIELKRKIPDKNIINWREQYLNNLKDIEPLSNSTIKPYGLEKGNSKIGQFGKYYNSVFVWNLPSVSTCPGASNWCMINCYNADIRSDKFPLDIWRENWWWFIHKKDELKNIINEQLLSAAKPCAVRLHSSGDFFSRNYIEFWHDIIYLNKEIAFWAYTRSWSVEVLMTPITQLKSLDNIQLFASWDKSMNKKPSTSWRKSIVADNIYELQTFNSKGNHICPEQFGDALNCASCNFCIKENKKNIIFILH